MSECKKECIFNSNNECWLACKNKFYNQAIDDVIKKLAESEDTILSDRQYYILMELKEHKNE